MNKDVHDIDELFRSALEEHEVAPSASVKEKLQTSLDKRDTESYKKRFIIWKRVSLLLLLLLGGILLFDSGLLQTENNGSTKKVIPGETTTKERFTENNPISFKKENLSNEKNNTGIPSNNTITTVDPQQGSTSNDHSVVNLEKKNTTSFYTLKQQDKVVQEKFNKGVDNTLNNKNVLLLSTQEKPAWVYDPFLLFTNINSPLNKSSLQQRSSPSLHDSLFKNNFPGITQNGKQKRFNPYWMMTGFFSYHQSGYRLDSDEPAAITSIKFREAHEPSFSGELLFTRQISPRIGLQTGLNYTNTAIGMKPQKTYAFRDPTGDIAYKYITSSGYAFIKPGFGPQPVVGDSLTTAEAKHNIQNISIPLAVKYTVLNKKISIVPGVGVEANFITKANLEVDIEDPFNREIVIVRKLNGTKTFYWSVVADAELRYNLNKKVAVTIRPAYRQALSPITENNIVETFPRGLGIGAGIQIKF